MFLLMEKGCDRTWIDGHERYVFPTNLRRPSVVNSLRPRLTAQKGMYDSMRPEVHKTIAQMQIVPMDGDIGGLRDPFVFSPDNNVKIKK